MLGETTMSQPNDGPDHETSYKTPGWVKGFGIVLVVLVLLVVIVLVTGLGGEHGPQRHMPSGDASVGTATVEQDVQVQGPANHTPPVEHGG